MNKTVLVTGASGYVGRHVCSALLDRGATVLAVHRRGQEPDPRAISIRSDFGDINKSWFEQSGTPDVCIHLAWSDGFNHNSNAHIDMLPKHAKFAEAAMQAGIKQFVGAGTMHEVGYWEGKITDATPNNPRSKYGIAKNALRELTKLAAAAEGSVFQWVRAYYILGDDLNNQSLFSKILTWESEGKQSFPFNSGTNEYDFILVEQLAQMIAAVAYQTRIVGTIDCCSGQPVSLRRAVEKFIDEHKLKIRPDYGAFPDRPYDSPRIWGDNAAIGDIMAADPYVATLTPSLSKTSEPHP